MSNRQSNKELKKYSRNNKHRLNANFSKLICIFTNTMFVLACVVSILMVDLFGYESATIPVTIITTTGALATASNSFYFVKAKAENLSKQLIRNIVLKGVFEEYIPSDKYEEILQEIENIDDTIKEKLQDMYREAINEDIEGDM